MTNILIYIGIALSLIALASMYIIRLSNKRKPKLVDGDGKKIKVSNETKKALINEYKLIKQKKSNFNRTKRDKIVELTEHLVEVGKIKKSQLEF